MASGLVQRLAEELAEIRILVYAVGSGSVDQVELELGGEGGFKRDLLVDVTGRVGAKPENVQVLEKVGQKNVVCCFVRSREGQIVFAFSVDLHKTTGPIRNILLL